MLSSVFIFHYPKIIGIFNKIIETTNFSYIGEGQKFMDQNINLVFFSR